MLTDKLNKIPLENKKNIFFDIVVNQDFFSIDILYNSKEKFNLENLFLILKSYTISKEILIKNIYMIGSNKDFLKNEIETKFFRCINLNQFSRNNYIDFLIFYENMYEYDWSKYLNNFNFYGFRIVILKESNIWLNKNFYPKYPWSYNFKENYIHLNNIITQIQKLKKENLILKRKIIKYSLYRVDGKFNRRNTKNRNTSIKKW